jgi:hypothetical protein
MKHQRPQINSARACAWCSVSQADLTDDHVFPYAIGGTKALKVPACLPCQQALSCLEAELSRRSPFALCTIERGPVGRHRRRPSSGVIQAEYVLVRDSLGGYAETLVQAGKPPRRLSSIEIAVVSGRHLARRRGGNPSEHHQLVRRLRNVLANESADRVEIKIGPQHELSSDPDFWPRAVLRSDGELFIRARNKEEAKFLWTEMRILLASSLVDDYSGWSSSELTGGATHHFCMRFDAIKVHRALMKIACSVAFLNYRELCSQLDRFLGVRDYVRNGIGIEPEYAMAQLGEFRGLDASADHHYAHVGPLRDRVIGALSVYGVRILVDFGPLVSGLRNRPAMTVTCRTDGKGCETLSDDLARQTAKSLLSNLDLSTENVNSTEPHPKNRECNLTGI